jgi:uncharacterized membrane protein
MDESVPLLPALGVAALQCAGGALVALVTRRAADGRLRRNQVAGIRTAATLRSDAAWRAGHAAAVPLSDLGGVALGLSGLVALWARRAPVFAGVLLSGTLVAIVLLLLGARRAVRAASAHE